MPPTRAKRLLNPLFRHTSHPIVDQDFDDEDWKIFGKHRRRQDDEYDAEFANGSRQRAAMERRYEMAVWED